MKKTIKRSIQFISIFILFIAVSFNSFSVTDLTSEQALNKLKEGNKRYVAGNSRYANLDQSRRDLTSTKGQHPFATIIGCSDSRAPIEHIFDVGIGEIFTIRVAGNVCDVDEAGSIEYGVDHLSTPLFVVLGHTSCGAVTAVAQSAELHGNIPALVDNIIPNVKERHCDDFRYYIDLSKEISPQQKQNLEKYIKSLESKLKNKKFLDNAPDKVIKQVKENLKIAKQKLK